MEKISNLLKDQMLFSRYVVSLLTYAHSEGYEVTLKECLRTNEQQSIYFKERKTKTMTSLHLKSLAIDLCFFKDGQWLKTYDQLKIFGKYWQNLDSDCRWGGDWNRAGRSPYFFDGLHFELNRGWY